VKKGAAVKKRKTEELADDKDKKDKYEPLMGAQGANAHGALMRGKSRKGAGKMECFRPFTEGVVIAEDKREVRCRIISEGLGNRVDMNYYGPEVIVQFAKMLNGSKCFINHPTSTEESQRPEGDLWNLEVDDPTEEWPCASYSLDAEKQVGLQLLKASSTGVVSGFCTHGRLPLGAGQNKSIW